MFLFLSVRYPVLVFFQHLFCCLFPCVSVLKKIVMTIDHCFVFVFLLLCDFLLALERNATMYCTVLIWCSFIIVFTFSRHNFRVLLPGFGFLLLIMTTLMSPQKWVIWKKKSIVYKPLFVRTGSKVRLQPSPFPEVPTKRQMPLHLFTPSWAR